MKVMKNKNLNLYSLKINNKWNPYLIKSKS